METETIADEIIMLVQQLLTTAGPEWTLQFLQAGMQEAGAGGGDMMPEPAMMQSQEMPMQARRTVGRPR